MITDYKPKERQDLEELYIKQNITIYELDQENKKLKEEVEVWKNANKKLRMHDARMEYENKKLKERIDVLYEFIERNDKLVDEVIENEDLDKLNWYIYIDDDLVDRTLESED